MKTRITLIAVVAWLVFLWVLFLVFQHQGRIQAGPGPQYLAGLAAVAAVLLVGAGVGSAIAGRPPQSAGDVVTSLAIGLAVFGIGSLALASLGLIRPYVFWILLAAAGIAARRNLRAVIRRFLQVRFPQDGTGSWGPFVALAVFAAGTSLVTVLAPLTANDALVYHLNVPRLYATNHGLVALPFNVYANMPHYGEMLYTMLFSLAGEAGAKMLYFFLLMGAAAATYVLAERFVSRGLALIAGALFLVQPLVLDHRIVCNVDVPLAYFYLSAATLLLDSTTGRQGARNALGAALLAGFMLGIKYTAILPAAALLVIPALTSSWIWKRVALGIGISLLVFLPWAVKNEIQVGNPVYPLMEGTFDGLHWDEDQSSQLISWQQSMGMGREALDYLLLPFRISIMGKPGSNYTRFDGILSPVFLILVPLALFRRKRKTTAIILMAGAGLIFWSVTSQQLRFLIPTLGLAAVLAVVGLANLRQWIGPKAYRVILVMVLLVLVSSLLVPDQYARPLLSETYDRLPAAIGLEQRQEFLGRNIQSYALFEQINQNLPPREPVFLIWENRGYYLHRPYFADSFFEASTLMRMVADTGSPEDLKHRMMSMGYTYVVVNELLGDFFSRAYPARSRTLLQEFISQHLSPIHSVNHLTLYTIEE